MGNSTKGGAVLKKFWDAVARKKMLWYNIEKHTRRQNYELLIL
jgi:hypothetical protein